MSTHVIRPLFPHPPLHARRYASLPAPGNYVPRWSIPYAGRMTGLSVVISPAVQ